MLLEINHLLQQPQLDKIHEVLADAKFQDGKLTAGMAAKQVKNNQEMTPVADKMKMIIRLITSALGHNEAFRNAALPYRMADPIIARYQDGMNYGNHVDDPIMGQSGPRFRTDISMTIFLHPKNQYEGGELIIQTSFGEKKVKLDAGCAVIYPSSSLHQVAPVTSGERLVALLWIQSYVRDPAKRELLYELSQARDYLLKNEIKADHTAKIDKSYVNLLRMWSDV